MIGLDREGHDYQQDCQNRIQSNDRDRQSAQKIVEEQGLVQISDEGAILAIVEQVVANNPQSVADFKAGKEKAIGFLVGQVMKETKGKANPGLANKLLADVLNR